MDCNVTEDIGFFLAVPFDGSCTSMTPPSRSDSGPRHHASTDIAGGIQRQAVTCYRSPRRPEKHDATIRGAFAQLEIGMFGSIFLIMSEGDLEPSKRGTALLEEEDKGDEENKKPGPAFSVKLINFAYTTTARGVVGNGHHVEVAGWKYLEYI